MYSGGLPVHDCARGGAWGDRRGVVQCVRGDGADAVPGGGGGGGAAARVLSGCGGGRQAAGSRGSGVVFAAANSGTRRSPPADRACSGRRQCRGGSSSPRGWGVAGRPCFSSSEMFEFSGPAAREEGSSCRACNDGRTGSSRRMYQCKALEPAAGTSERCDINKCVSAANRSLAVAAFSAELTALAGGRA